MSEGGYYILDVNRNPVECSDITKWTRWNTTANRNIIRSERDDVLVSTVFLGIGWGNNGNKPLLFESMAFDHDGDELDCERYATWKEAQDGHLVMCKNHLKNYTESDLFLDML